MNLAYELELSKNIAHLHILAWRDLNTGRILFNLDWNGWFNAKMIWASCSWLPLDLALKEKDLQNLSNTAVWKFRNTCGYLALVKVWSTIEKVFQKAGSNLRYARTVDESIIFGSGQNSSDDLKSTESNLMLAGRPPDSVVSDRVCSASELYGGTSN